MLGCVLRWMAFDWGVAEIRNCDCIFCMEGIRTVLGHLRE